MNEETETMENIELEKKIVEVTPTSTIQERKELAEKAGILTDLYIECPQYEQISLKNLERDLERYESFARYYLCGSGQVERQWIYPLSKGVLLSLIEAQETKKFVRFEIWELEKDPILVGFVRWREGWVGGVDSGLVWSVNSDNGKNDRLFNMVTYKICEWE